MKKVLVAYANWHGVFGEAIHQSFKDLNYSTLRSESHMLPYYWEQKFPKKLFGFLYFWAISLKDTLTFLFKCITFRPNLIVFCKSESIIPSPLKFFKKIFPSKVVTWWPDDPLLFPFVTNNYWQTFDKIFIYDTGIIQRLKKRFPDFIFNPLPLSASKQSHFLPISKPPQSREKRIVFIGSAYPNRLKIMDSLCNYPLLLIGSGWPQNSNITLLSSVKSDQAKFLYQENLICLNIHDVQSVNSPNTRFFEIFMAGGIQIVEPLPEIVQILGKDYPFYYNSLSELNELVKKIFSWEKNFPNLENLIKTWQNNFIENHDYTNRIKEFLKN